MPILYFVALSQLALGQKNLHNNIKNDMTIIMFDFNYILLTIIRLF